VNIATNAIAVNTINIVNGDVIAAILIFGGAFVGFAAIGCLVGGEIADHRAALHRDDREFRPVIHTVRIWQHEKHAAPTAPQHRYPGNGTIRAIASAGNARVGTPPAQSSPEGGR